MKEELLEHAKLSVFEVVLLSQHFPKVMNIGQGSKKAILNTNFRNGRNKKYDK